jgi:hypothetical protein
MDARMLKLRGLLLDRPDYGWVSMTDVHDSDPARKVDELPAISVDQSRTRTGGGTDLPGENTYAPRYNGFASRD